MGNSSSAGRHQEDTVDYGSLVPQGVYTGARDWNQPIVSQLIAARKLAPFYRPLEDYEESWDDDQILAARKEFPESTGEHADTRGDHSSSLSAHHTSSKLGHGKRPSSTKEFRPEAAIYRGAVECPICFLYYPRNINHSRCCDQAICTECFVQIKRAEPTTTHLVSEPAACPYCVQENFGIVYTPPLWRAGIGSDGSHPLIASEVARQAEQASVPTHKRRQKSFSADSPEVVTIDQIRPDWEAKLAAVRAAVARRANRRIIMRQVGDRLIPVGIGRIQTPEEAAEGGNSGSGSRRRRHHHPPNGEFTQYLGMAGQDLEELMLMEAMRLSLIDHEEHQRKEAEERKKKEDEERATGGGASSSGPDGTGNSSQAGGSSSQAASSSTTPGPFTNLSPAVPGSGSTSRSRTPEPPPSLNRTPPPFSAMNAALLTSGTATAFLNSSSAPGSTSDTSNTPVPAITLTEGGHKDWANEPSKDDRSTAASSSFSPSSALTGELPQPSSATTFPASTSSSSFGGPDPSLAGFVAYGTLPSSPESTGQSPLLGAVPSDSKSHSATDNDTSPPAEATQSR